MKKTFFILGLLSATPTVAEVPDVAYAHDYLRQKCHNPNLKFGDADPKSLVSNKYFMGLIDELNKDKVHFITLESLATSYAADATNDNIISVKVLDDNLSKFGDTETCCRGGRIDPDTGKCHACIPFAVGENAACPKNFSKIKFDNLTIADSADACPTGTEVYYQSPCDDSITFDDSGDMTYISMCYISHPGYVNDNTGMTNTDGNRIICGYDCTRTPGCKDIKYRGELRLSAASYGSADNFDVNGNIRYCRATHIYTSDGVLAPVESRWVLHPAIRCFHDYDYDWVTDVMMGVLQYDE